MNDRTSHLDPASLSGFLTVLRRRAIIVALCLLAVPGAAFAYSSSRPKEYTADSQVLLQAPGFEAAAATGNASAAAGAPDTPDLATDVGVASLESVAALTAKALGPPFTPAGVNGAVKATTTGDANLIGFEATARRPGEAARLANAYARQFIAFRRSQDVGRIDATRTALAGELRNVEARLARATARQGTGSARQKRLDALNAQEDGLRERVQNLGTLATVQTGNATVVQHATAPSTPSAPRTTRNVVGGIALGLLLGILLAVLFEVLDQRVRNPSEIERLFGQPLLGAIPRSKALGNKRALRQRMGAADKESFRMVQANLRYSGGDDATRSVLVTSAASGDGKSTVAWNLAVAAAEAGARVLLVEADLRRASLAGRLGVTVKHGLTDVLAKHRPLADVIHQVPIGDPDHGLMNGSATIPLMDVVFAGRKPRNPRGLIASERMSEVIADAEREYDFIVLDAPPAAVVSDAIPLIRQVSGVLVVTRLRKSTRDATEHLRDQLHSLHAPILGVVVNSIDVHDGFYGSAYASANDYAITTAS